MPADHLLLLVLQGDSVPVGSRHITHQHIIWVQVGGVYTISNKASISNPSVGTVNISSPVTRNISQYCGASFDPSTAEGYVKQNSWQDIYYLFTITNTGNITDSFTLSTPMPGTGSFNMNFGVITTLAGVNVTGTPSLAPNATFTFLVHLQSGTGVNKGDVNTTQLIATSFVCGSTTNADIITHAGDSPK